MIWSSAVLADRERGGRDCHFLGFLGRRDVAGGDDVGLALDSDCRMLCVRSD